MRRDDLIRFGAKCGGKEGAATATITTKAHHCSAKSAMHSTSLQASNKLQPIH